MLIYRDDLATATTAERLAALRRLARQPPRSPDAWLDLLIDAGEFESGVVDAITPGIETGHPARTLLRALTCSAARGWLAAWRGTAADERLEGMLDRVERVELPSEIRLSVSEGYAYYALFPHAYVAAAIKMHEERRPERVVVLGIRNIGTSLSAAVAAALEGAGCEVASWTIRPTGHPFDRRVRVAGDVAGEWRRHASRGALFAVVDEGPGLSGSSFAAAIDALTGAGVPSAAIALFPSWDPDPIRLGSERARRAWASHPRYRADAAAIGITPERLFSVPEPVVDFSGGRWRAHLLRNAPWPAAQPQHERWKTFVPSMRRLLRFAGLGRYGSETMRRAKALEDAGLGPRVSGLRTGFLDVAFVSGAPILDGAPEGDEPGAMGTYIGTRAVVLRGDGGVDAGELWRMIDTNTREILGGEAAAAVPGVDVVRRALDGVRAAPIDGRMLRHEWLRTSDGLRKVDAVDHDRDHFFPGRQHPAWDLAGAIQEFGLDGAAARATVQAYALASGDSRAGEVLPLYGLAYAAFRAGYAAVAADALAGTDEGRRFDLERSRRRDALSAALRVTPSAL